MHSKSARNNMIRLLRSKLLVNSTVAGHMAERAFVDHAPLHDAVLTVEDFSDDGKGLIAIRRGDDTIGRIYAHAGEMNRWLASEEGLARIAHRAAEDAAELARQKVGTVVLLWNSDRWPGTAEVVLDDRTVLPLIPCAGESADDVRAVHQDIRPGSLVRIRILKASEIVDDFARTMDPDQPCADWIMLERAA